MPVDQFCNMDTIGTRVKFGKIGLTGRTSKVDTTAEMRNQGIAKDVAPGRLAAERGSCLHDERSFV